MRKLITLFIVVLLFISKVSSATHIMGGEISYKYVKTNKYYVTVTLYRDCAGVNAPSNITLSVVNPYNSKYNSSYTFALIGSPVDITPSCVGGKYSSTCSGGNDPGVQKCTYSDTVSLSDTCSNWILSFTLGNRNSAISNLNLGSGKNIYVEVHLNNASPLAAKDNSPVFYGAPIPFIKYKDTTIINCTATDADGDSLVYELSPPKDAATSTISYITGLSYLKPFKKDTLNSFDSTTGLYQISPASAQVTVCVVTVKEYRKGVFIGSVERDMEIMVFGSFFYTKGQPYIYAFNNNSYYNTHTYVNDTVDMVLSINDRDTSQRIGAKVDSIRNLYFTIDTFAHPHIHIQYVADSFQLSHSPAIVYIHLTDNSCPLRGSNTYALKIYTHPRNKDVWPGDCNNDQYCNMYDILYMGLAYGDTGSARSGAFITWSPQACKNWVDTFITGVNHKHADTDGDGMIGLSDTLAIVTNYGDIHPRRLSKPKRNAPTIFVHAGDTLKPGDTFNYPIIAGDSSTPLYNMYGLAFRLYYSKNVIDDSSLYITFDSSWIGTKNSTMITLSHINRKLGYFDIALSGINHLNRSGLGTIAHMHGKILNGLSNDSGIFNISDTKCIDTIETPLLLSTKLTKVYIKGITTNVKKLNTIIGNISIAPTLIEDNSFKYINTTYHKVSDIVIYDAIGRVVKKLSIEDSNTIEVIGLSNGAYMICFHLDNGYNAVKRIVIQR